MTPLTTLQDAFAAVEASKQHFFAKRRLTERARAAAAVAANKATLPAIRRELYETAYIAVVNAALKD